jgi:kinesin family protein 20
MSGLMRVQLFEAEMRASVVEAEIREEVMKEMEERMQAMERMFMRRLASEVRFLLLYTPRQAH